MKIYDPMKFPNPEKWLALDEGIRLKLVEAYHQTASIELPNARLHAMFHAIVETQIAEGAELPVKRVLYRLMREGLDRHEAVHAIATVLAEFIHGTMSREENSGDPNPAYFRKLKRLTAKKWLKMAE